MRQKPVVIIYHDIDGFAAAWVAHKYWTEDEASDVVLHAAKYGEEPPYELCQDAIVCVVDFSYSRQQLLKLDCETFDLTVIDHHKTAIEACEGLSFCVFDVDRSGAGLTWDTLYSGQPRPLFIDYVEDRDLWRFKLPGSKAVNAYIGTVPRTLEAFDNLSEHTWSDLALWGSGCLAQLEHYATATALLGRSFALFEPGQPVWCVNCSPVGVSEVCDAALKLLDAPEAVAMGWYIADGELRCSLRSGGETDVSVIAKRFGGGGHKNAAEFKVMCHPNKNSYEEWAFINKLLE